MKQTWPPLAELSTALQKKRAPHRLMDSVDVCAATSTADSNDKRHVHKRNRDWLNRLHLRKAALQPHAMQNPDKPGPKKIAAAAERASTTWPPSKKQPNHEELKRAIHSGNLLRFRCSQCTDSVERAPKDLLKHFDEKHKGCPPVFSCHMCKFTTHEFSYLQVHVLGHKDTFSCCSLCKDDVQRTWAEFNAHLTMVHTQNGKYTCDVCKKFSSSDDKEFLEHVLLHSLGLDMKNEQAIGKMTAYKCQFCGYEASQKIILTKHMTAIHGNLNYNQRNTEVNAFSKSDSKGKPQMTRSAVKDISWLTQDCLSLPGREFLDKYCHLSDTKTTLEETEQFLMTSGKQRWSKALKNVLSNVPHEVKLQSKPENGTVSVSPDSSQDVLTVKNKMNQNATSFAKRLKLMTEKEVESADADSCEKIVINTNLSDCLQNQELKPSSEVLIELREGPSLEENRENHRLKTRLNERNADEVIQDGVISNDLNAEERKVVRKALPKNKLKSILWRKMKKRTKKVDKSQALKIVLKKNTKTGKQWVTETSKTPAKCTSTNEKMSNNMDFGRGEGTIQDKIQAEKPVEKIQDGRDVEEDEESVLVMREKSKDRSDCADLRASAELKTPPDGSTEASPLAQPVITAHSESAPPAVPPPPSADHTDSSTSETLPSPEGSPTSKTVERTLYLLALSPSQLVKRPAGCQPVVVLNHPDVDVPEVSRIMEVVKKYKGEIHKVVLSKQTLNAITGRGRSTKMDSDSFENPVRERFLLKLKLRRLSKKKFEVVNGDTSSAPDAGDQTFRCWFCGRVFGSREVWLSHKQRHLLDWKSPNCENS